MRLATILLYVVIAATTGSTAGVPLPPASGITTERFATAADVVTGLHKRCDVTVFLPAHPKVHHGPISWFYLGFIWVLIRSD